MHYHLSVGQAGLGGLWIPEPRARLVFWALFFWGGGDLKSAVPSVCMCMLLGGGGRGHLVAELMLDQDPLSTCTHLQISVKEEMLRICESQ